MEEFYLKQVPQKVKQQVWVGDVLAVHIETVYSKYGDWFGWLNCIAAVGLVVWIFVRRKKQA